MKLFTCTLPIAPIPKGRPRFWRGKAVTPLDTRQYERSVAALLRHERGPREPFEGGIFVRLIFRLPRPAKPSRPYPSRADLDNLVKAVTDAANEILWKDDTQIVKLEAVKEYGTPGTEIWIEAITP